MSKYCRVDYSIGSMQKPEFNGHEKSDTCIKKKYFITSSQVLQYFTVKASEVNPMEKKKQKKRRLKTNTSQSLQTSLNLCKINALTYSILTTV